MDEALRAAEHPGIVFRPGPTGRRAGLVGGPDVWEIIGALHAVRAEDADLADESLMAAVAEATGLSPRVVRIAIPYYAAYPAEVEERIAANHEAAQEARSRPRERQNVRGLN